MPSYKRKRELLDRLSLCLHILSTTAPYEDTALSVALFNELHIIAPELDNRSKEELRSKLDKVVLLADSMSTRAMGDAVILRHLSEDLLRELNKKIEPKKHIIYF